jgi:hypothetical protein
MMIQDSTLGTCQEACKDHPDCDFYLFVTVDFPLSAQHFECYLKWGGTENPIFVTKLGVLSGRKNGQEIISV